MAVPIIPNPATDPYTGEPDYFAYAARLARMSSADLWRLDRLMAGICEVCEERAPLTYAYDAAACASCIEGHEDDIEGVYR